MPKVAVLGAGINGLSCAVKIKEKYPNVDKCSTSFGLTAESFFSHARTSARWEREEESLKKDSVVSPKLVEYLSAIYVVLISSQFTPHTTGDGSGGLWFPYLCGITSQELLSKWGCETYKYLLGLWREGGHDVCLLPMYGLRREPAELQAYAWASQVLGYRVLDQRQLDYLNGLYTVKYVSGITFTTIIAYPPTILAHLHRRFTAANGQTEQHKISSLRDAILDDCDVVINCLGLGAREAVPDDKVVPIRGQIAKVQAPWVTNALIDENSGHYILPNVHNCVLGGTSQKNSFQTDIVDDDTKFIFNGCTQIMPGLKNAKLVTQWVGLRPGRESVRLEPEERDGKLYIHNYGHGGSGLTLFWGCATDVLEIFDRHMNKHKEKSKL